MFKSDDLPNIIQKFPFLQTQHVHPYMQQLVVQHKLDIICLIDTRCVTRPTWNLPGYTLIAHKPPMHANNPSHIGGIMIYRKRQLKNNIHYIQKTRGLNTVWLSIDFETQTKPTYLSVNYVRPFSTKTLERSQKFYNTLTADINRFKSQYQNVYIIGDFNARMGAETTDHNTNAHFQQNAISAMQTSTLNNTKCNISYADQHFVLRGYDPKTQLKTKHRQIITKRLKHIQKFSTGTDFYTSPNDRSFISNIISLCTMYTLHLATIKAFGVSDFESVSKWSDSSIKRIDLNIKQNCLNNTNNEYAQGKEILKTAWKLHKQQKINNLRRNTINFSNLNHCQKLKRYKNMNRNLDYLEDEPYLRYKNKLVPKNTALSDFFAKINGPITDPKSNAKIHDINQFNINLHNFTHNTIRFIPSKPKKGDDTDEPTPPPPPLETHAKNPEPWLHQNHMPNIPHFNPDFLDKNANEQIEMYEIERRLINEVSSKTPNETHSHSSNIIPNFDLPTNTCDTDNADDPDPSLKYTSVEMAMQFANASSAPGYDGIKSQHLSLNADVVNQLLCTMFNTWNATYVIPYYCRLGSIISILKTPDGDTPNQYRPITLLQLIFKAYERLILWRMNIDHQFRRNLHILQGGNRAKRGVPEQIGTLHLIAQTAKLQNKPLYCASLDIKKAFDTVWRKGLFYKLHTNFQIPINICKLIKAIYDNSHSAIRDIPFVTQIFQLQNGVLQGSVLSPILFAAFINDMIDALQSSQKGATSPDPNQLIACIFYADDVVLVANTIENLAALLRICEKHSNDWAYNFNAKKCKAMIYNDASILMNNVHHHNTTQKTAITNEYHSKIQIRTQKQAPMVLIQRIINNKIMAVDIDGYVQPYTTAEVPDDILNSFKDHCRYYKNKITDKPYHII